MRAALKEAEFAAQSNEVPIGAALIRDNQILASASNSCEADHNPLQHAEIKVLLAASQKLNNWRLSDCTLFVTLEPCPMCLGALFQARVGELVFGCADSKRVTINTSQQSVFMSLTGKTELIDNNHRLKITSGILKEECSEILKEFFRKKRNNIKME